MLEKGILQHKFLFNHIWKGDQYPAYLHPHLLLLLGALHMLLVLVLVLLRVVVLVAREF
jgi:hypothetical protein